MYKTAHGLSQKSATRLLLTLVLSTEINKFIQASNRAPISVPHNIEDEMKNIVN